jgi:Na+/phosphate symporter
MEAREELDAFNTKIANAKEELFDMKSICAHTYREYEKVYHKKQSLEALVQQFEKVDPYGKQDPEFHEMHKGDIAE